MKIVFLVLLGIVWTALIGCGLSGFVQLSTREIQARLAGALFGFAVAAASYPVFLGITYLLKYLLK